MQTLKQVITKIRTRFNEELETKAGWGKNELKQVHDNVIIEVLSEVEENNNIKLQAFEQGRKLTQDNWEEEDWKDWEELNN